MPRPKSYKDLPRYMTARRSGGRLLYYYQAPGQRKRPLGSDKALALRQWAELEAQGVVGASTFAKARDEVGETWELRDLRKKAITDEPDLTTASQRAGHSDETITATTYRLVKGRKVKPGRGV